MKKVFSHWWQACCVGLLVGVPVGIGLEYVRLACNEAAIEKTARQFEANGMSPPLMIDFLQPWVVPLLTAAIFLLLALSIHTIFSRLRRTWTW